jgi:BlaI family transcriptional regulator, penicillinase repressor
MKKELPRISDAEWDVMQVAWRRGDFTAQEMIDELSHREWSPRTVKTLIGRLLAKGALAHEARGKAYVYRPAVKREDCVRQESESFLDRVFGGAAAPLLAHFVKRSRLTPEDIAALRRILDEKEKDR